MKAKTVKEKEQTMSAESTSLENVNLREVIVNGGKVICVSAGTVGGSMGGAALLAAAGALLIPAIAGPCALFGMVYGGWLGGKMALRAHRGVQELNI